MTKNKVGRPRMFENPEDMLEKAEEYFKTKRLEGRPFTVVGLALYLGFADKQSLIDYSEREEFSFTIKKIKSKIEEHLEERLSEPSPTGTIFNLKNNFGWKDKQEVDQNIKADVAVALPTQLGAEDWAQKFKR